MEGKRPERFSETMSDDSKAGCFILHFDVVDCRAGQRHH
jgi:hypothetical protein